MPILFHQLKYWISQPSLITLLFILLKIALLFFQGTGHHLDAARPEEVVPDISGQPTENPPEELLGNPAEDVPHSAPAFLAPVVVGHGIRTHVNFKNKRSPDFLIFCTL